MAIEAVDPRARGLRNRSSDEAYGIVGLTRRLDWVLIAAAGAAAVPPWPPFSITAHTTIDGLSVGPYPHHHDWLSFTGLG